MNAKRTRQRRISIGEAFEGERIGHRQIAAVNAAAGAWEDQDHPELKQGSAKWVRKLRPESVFAE